MESDNPAFVSVLAKSAKEFQITVASVKDRDVTVSVLQEEDDSYSEATKEFSFQIQGTVKGALPVIAGAGDSGIVGVQEVQPAHLKGIHLKLGAT